jgi:hypothetical protein
MMTTQQQAGWRALIAQFSEVFLAAAEERVHRPEFIDSPDGPEMAWVIYERTQMLNAVNAERAARDLPPVPAEDVIRAERQACGHCDYVKKYAIGCADLVVGARHA